MKIVLAVDGSKYSTWATQWIARLPLTSKPQVTAVHVLDLAALRAPFMVQPVVIGNEPFILAETKRLEDRARKVKAETTDLLASLELEGKVLSLQGAVAPTILKRIPGRNSLAVVGHRGLDALDRFMLGSVSTYVIHHAPCSVLVVKQPSRTIRRIVLAVDGSKASERGLAFLLEHLRPRDIQPNGTEVAIEVAVTHVMPFIRYPEVKETSKALVHYHAERLEKTGYRVEEVARLGHPADEIIKVSERQKTDLIVAGARGLGAVGRFFLGSVTTKLLHHSTCSVLVAR